MVCKRAVPSAAARDASSSSPSRVARVLSLVPRPTRSSYVRRRDATVTL